LLAIEKSQDDLNDESLFGSLNTDQNLLDKGNIALGSNLNNSANIDKVDIVFHDASPVDNGTDDEGSGDEPKTPVIQPCHLHVRYLGIGTYASNALSMSIKLQLGHCT
jgi:hypothetical protein